MARLIQASRRALTSHSFIFPKALIPQLPQTPQSPQIQSTIASLLSQTRHYMSEMRKSTFEGHILRVLRNEIQYETEYAPPKQPVTEYKSFTVQDFPGEQWIRLRSKHDDDKEKIKIEVTMFDGAIPSPSAKDEEEMQLHISFIVDVRKGDDGDQFQFVCSAWPDSIDIQKVFFIKPNAMQKSPYMGPDFKDLDDQLQKSLMEFLEERGIDDDLAGFLHEYMMNKDRSELIRWMGNVKSFVEQ